MIARAQVTYKHLDSLEKVDYSHFFCIDVDELAPRLQNMSLQQKCFHPNGNDVEESSLVSSLKHIRLADALMELAICFIFHILYEYKDVQGKNKV
ncbi:hypothetical protein NPIL_215311 [Nephila pilipes]|uniref:Uncharacterized protein n=1 Tax=Nephila pilipes TaxID=299642 RepID=A0A8X6TQM5_NEPPI|nr:hypothetical protein NPIL_215311 [Nephila pilipes]